MTWIITHTCCALPAIHLLLIFLSVFFCSSVNFTSVSSEFFHPRLDRLLKRGKFDQAEAFGQKFGLPVETIYKAKLRKLLQDLQPWTNSEVSLEETFVEALNLLDEIQVHWNHINFLSKSFYLLKRSSFQLLG